MTSQASTLTPIRRCDIDWLRILATYLLFAFQASKLLHPGPFSQVDQAGPSFSLGTAGFFVSQWYVPLVFLLSGWSRKNAMQQLPAGRSLRERVFRLLVPFLAGCALICPFLRYVQLLSGPGGGGTDQAYPESFPAFLLDFFTRADMFTWMHLWLLFYLFVITLVTWPFFINILGKKVTPIKISRAWAYVPAGILGVIQVAGARFLGADPYGGWAGPVYFLAYFTIGFAISRYSAYERVVHQEAKRAGFAGLALFFFIMLASSHLPTIVSLFLAAAASWLFVMGILGFAKRFLDVPSAWLPYLRESTLPVYLFHLVPVVLIGSVIVPMPGHGYLKALGLFLSSLGTTLVVYHFFIRRMNLLRLLFGMKQEKVQNEGWKDQSLHRDRG